MYKLAEDLFPMQNAAFDYAMGGLAVVPSHYPVPGGEHPCSGGPVLECSCGNLWCATPARHLIGAYHLDDASTDAADVCRRWMAHPDGNIATPAGLLFNSVQFQDPGVPEHLLAWLEGNGITPGPVLQADRGTLEFLVKPGPLLVSQTHGTLTSVGYGGLVLLPPSRTIGGDALAWLRPLETELPPGDPLVDALAQVPDPLDKRRF